MRTLTPGGLPGSLLQYSVKKKKLGTMQICSSQILKYSFGSVGVMFGSHQIQKVLTQKDFFTKIFFNSRNFRQIQRAITDFFVNFGHQSTDSRTKNRVRTVPYILLLYTLPCRIFTGSVKLV